MPLEPLEPNWGNDSYVLARLDGAAGRRGRMVRKAHR